MGAEQIARISGSGLRWDAVHGGIPAVSMEELMGALAGLGVGPELAIRVAICGQKDMIPALQREVFLELGVVAVAQKWKMVTGKPVMRTLANRAVQELADPKCYFCAACGGSGSRVPTPKNPSDICPKCNGAATIEPSGRSMAEAAGIDEANWRRTWAPRLADARRIVNGWMQDGVRHINRMLADER